MKIAVVGSGYVGSACAALLAQKNEVVLLDVSAEKVNQINNNISPIEDSLITEFLESGNLNIRATLDKEQAYKGADYVVVAVPTDYNPETNYFNTSLVEHVIKDANWHNPKSTIVIKSTIPIGYVNGIRNKLNCDNVIFSPEFLREGSALYDNLYPDRIIIGEVSERARIFGELLKGAARSPEVPILYMGSSEAEAVKLFANGYMAMRVAFFNELDSYAEANGLNSKDIIEGASLASRIGNYYNNPSFGYGGYCFPKDTKQLVANFEASGVKNSIIKAIVESNEIRKDHIKDRVLNRLPVMNGTIGVYRLTMKADSDNFRASAMQDVIARLRTDGKNIIIFEPTIHDTNFNGIPVVNNMSEFCEMSDVIIANRIEPALEGCLDKVYTRDIFNTDR